MPITDFGHTQYLLFVPAHLLWLYFYSSSSPPSSSPSNSISISKHIEFKLNKFACVCSHSNSYSLGISLGTITIARLSELKFCFLHFSLQLHVLRKWEEEEEEKKSACCTDMAWMINVANVIKWRQILMPCIVPNIEETTRRKINNWLCWLAGVVWLVKSLCACMFTLNSLFTGFCFGLRFSLNCVAKWKIICQINTNIVLFVRWCVPTYCFCLSQLTHHWCNKLLLSRAQRGVLVSI